MNWEFPVRAGSSIVLLLLHSVAGLVVKLSFECEVFELGETQVQAYGL